MYYIEKVLSPGKGFSCVFRQHAAKSHCNRMHGYDLIFGTKLAAKELDENGWVFDFGGFKAIESILKDTFDHKVVVAEDDPFLDDICALEGLGVADVVVLPQVGCEAFAGFFNNVVQGHLTLLGESKRVSIVETWVREHEGNSAGYAP